MLLYVPAKRRTLASTGVLVDGGHRERDLVAEAAGGLGQRPSPRCTDHGLADLVEGAARAAVEEAVDDVGQTRFALREVDDLAARGGLLLQLRPHPQDEVGLAAAGRPNDWHDERAVGLRQHGLQYLVLCYGLISAESPSVVDSHAPDPRRLVRRQEHGSRGRRGLAVHDSADLRGAPAPEPPELLGFRPGR